MHANNDSLTRPPKPPPRALALARAFRILADSYQRERDKESKTPVVKSPGGEATTGASAPDSEGPEREESTA